MLPKIKRARFRAPIIALGMIALSVLPGPPAQPAAAAVNVSGYSTEDVQFDNDGLTLHGTILSPIGDPSTAGPLAGVVLVAGAGSRTRDEYWNEAEAFAEAGIVALVYDKRTVGYSLTERSFPQLADDALAAVELLRDRADVDPGLVGLWGHSEGGWVVPLAASRSENVAFVIATGASALSPSRTQAWSNCQYLKHAGFPERLCGPVGANLTRILIAGNLFPEADYDPIPAMESLEIPVLVLLGEFDQSSVPIESAELFVEALRDNQLAQVTVIPQVDHNFYSSPDGFEHEDDDFAPAYFEAFTSWVHRVENADVASSRDSIDRADRHSTTLTPLGWYESLPAHAIALGVLLIAFVSYPVSALALRLRGRRPRPVAAIPARILSVTGVVTVLATTSFLGYLVATGATQPLGPVVLGRPLIWLALQLVAIAALGATAWAIVLWARQRRRMSRGASIRLLLLLSGGVLLLPWAAYWGLLTP